MGPRQVGASTEPATVLFKVEGRQRLWGLAEEEVTTACCTSGLCGRTGFDLGLEPGPQCMRGPSGCTGREDRWGGLVDRAGA